jgi:tRNA(Ile)-lysidine synthase
MAGVLERMCKTIARYQMLGPGNRVIAAVSGGPDSVCLLHALREIQPRLGFRLAGVAHFNHKLRGEASDEDERFVERLTRTFDLEFYCASAEVAQAPGNLEQAARRARRAFFRSLIERGLAERIALGHTRDDQAETVLFRLLRGSGLAGLAAILPVTSEGAVRPLLGVTRAEVLAFLKDREIAWREDATNLEPRFARNRIRRSLLPQLSRNWNPRLAETLAHLADLAYAEERWWAEEIGRRAERILVASQGAVELRAQDLMDLPLAMARRLVRLAIRRAKGGLTGVEFGHIERVLELAGRPAGAGRVELPGVEVTRSFDWLRLVLPGIPLRSEPRRVGAPGRHPSPDGNTLICLDIIQREQIAQGCVTLGWNVAGGLELRGWRPGDHYRPAGYSRDHKLRELFQKGRIPSWRRPGWPILTYEDKILWARQFGPADAFCGSGPGCRVRIHEIPAGT